MKIFAFLMAIMILAQSVMPCADAAEAIDDREAKSEFTKSAHHEDIPLQDDCSPFCQCSCCAGFSKNHLVAALPILPQYESNPKSNFLPAEVREIALPIWQPPQLV